MDELLEEHALISAEVLELPPISETLLEEFLEHQRISFNVWGTLSGAPLRLEELSEELSLTLGGI